MRHHHNTTTPDPRTPEHIRDAILAARITRILGGIPTLRLVLATDESAQAPAPRESKEARAARVLAECQRIAPR